MELVALIGFLPKGRKTSGIKKEDYYTGVLMEKKTPSCNMSEDCYREFVISTRIIPSQEDRQFCSNRDFCNFLYHE